MNLRQALPAIVALALVLSAGCAAIQSGPTPSPTLSNGTAGDRAVAAEEHRLRRIDEGHDRIIGLGFEIMGQSESQVRRRNASGVVVRVSVSYSASIDCDTDGSPELASDGANTVATYLVTAEATRLQSVSQAFLDPARPC